MKVLHDPALRPYLRLLFWGAAAFALIMALIPSPPHLPGNPSDKIQHAAAFATLGVLGSFAYPRLAVDRLIIGLSLFGAFIELAQAIPIIHRDCDPVDWVADTLACVFAVVLVRWWRARTR